MGGTEYGSLQALVSTGELGGRRTWTAEWISRGRARMDHRRAPPVQGGPCSSGSTLPGKWSSLTMRCRLKTTQPRGHDNAGESPPTRAWSICLRSRARRVLRILPRWIEAAAGHRATISATRQRARRRRAAATGSWRAVCHQPTVRMMFPARPARAWQAPRIHAREGRRSPCALQGGSRLNAWKKPTRVAAAASWTFGDLRVT